MEEKQDMEEANLNYAGWQGEQGRTLKANLGETEFEEGSVYLAKGPCQAGRQAGRQAGFPRVIDARWPKGRFLSRAQPRMVPVGPGLFLGPSVHAHVPD